MDKSVIRITISVLVIILFFSTAANAWFPPKAKVELKPRFINHDDDEGSPTYCEYYFIDENGVRHELCAHGLDGLFLDENNNHQYDEGERYWQDMEGHWILMPAINDPNEHHFVPCPPYIPPPGPGAWWWEPSGIMSPEDTDKFNSFGNHLNALHIALSGIPEFDYDTQVAETLSNIYGNLIPDNPLDPTDLSNYQVLLQRRIEYYPDVLSLSPPSELLAFHSTIVIGLSEPMFISLPYENLDNNVFTTQSGPGLTRLVNMNGSTEMYNVTILRSGDNVNITGTYLGQPLPPEIIAHPILLVNTIISELMS